MGRVGATREGRVAARQAHGPLAPPGGYASGMTDGRRPPHPSNTLNELSGEEWLYFTKSVWTTAYPSELGHVMRKRHGAKNRNRTEDGKPS